MIALLTTLTILAAQGVDVSVNAAPGEAVSGVRTFRATVNANDPVTQVEFYVGDELRDSDVSQPYEFKLDTIDENDGDLRLTFAAYTSKGDSSKKILNVKVDNGLSRGAQYHADLGLEYLTESKWDEAIVSARIALKATPGFNLGRKVMARAYLGKAQLDKAQKYAEDWVESEPANLEAKELLAGINVNRAFGTVSRGSDRNEALRSIVSAFEAAIETRHQGLDVRLAQIGKPTEENVVAYADAAIRAQRFSLAISALTPFYRATPGRYEISNRLAYAQLRAGRIIDALNTLSTVKRFDGLDAYGLSLYAVLEARRGDTNVADQHMRQAILADSESYSVKTAQAYLSLVRNQTYALTRISADLEVDAGARPEVAYYLFAVSNALKDASNGRKYFQRAVLAEPLIEEAYLEEANRALASALAHGIEQEETQFRFESAKAMYEIALKVRPESHRALEGLALATVMLGKKESALDYALAAAKAAPDQASTFYTLASVYRTIGKASEGALANQKAWKLDELRLRGRVIPTPIEALNYLITYDRVPVLALPR